MAKAPTRAVTKAQETQVVNTLEDDDFFGLATGMEDVTSADVSLPRWSILQGLSPQVNPRKDEYIPGAQIGMIMNTATGLVTESIKVVMAAYQRRNIEWIPRDKPCPIPNYPQLTGGGLYRDYGTDESVLSECALWDKNGSLWTPRGNELVVTGTWYTIDPDTLSTAFIAMGKTQFTPSKKLMAGIRDEKVMIRGVLQPAPLFYRVWELNTRIKADGENEWFVWNHKPAGLLREHANGRVILQMVQEINRTIREGEMHIDVAVGETEGSVGKGDQARM